jgi:hypothetical protein
MTPSVECPLERTRGLRDDAFGGTVNRDDALKKQNVDGVALCSDLQLSDLQLMFAVVKGAYAVRPCGHGAFQLGRGFDTVRGWEGRGG